MPLDTPGFKLGFKALLQDMLTRETNSIDDFVNGVGNLVETLIKTADVKAGISVTTSGTSSAQTGRTTTTGQLE